MMAPLLAEPHIYQYKLEIITMFAKAMPAEKLSKLNIARVIKCCGVLDTLFRLVHANVITTLIQSYYEHRYSNLQHLTWRSLVSHRRGKDTWDDCPALFPGPYTTFIDCWKEFVGEKGSFSFSFVSSSRDNVSSQVGNGHTLSSFTLRPSSNSFLTTILHGVVPFSGLGQHTQPDPHPGA